MSGSGLGSHGLLYGCETWTLTKDVRRRLNSFGTRSLRRILGYRWSDFVSNERLLRETWMRFVTCIVCEHQLRLYGHVARFPDADPAHQILSARELREWRRPMGRPCASWLQKVDLVVAASILQRPPSRHPPGRCLTHPHLLEKLINLLQP